LKFLKRFKNLDAINISKLIPKTSEKIALTYDYILYKKVLTEVVKRLVNRAMSLQNKNRIKDDIFRKKTELAD